MLMPRPSNHTTLPNYAEGQRIDLENERNEAEYATAAPGDPDDECTKESRMRESARMESGMNNLYRY
jgi:hypothetical protein